MGFTYLKTYIFTFRRPLPNFGWIFFFYYSELNDSDQHTIFYMLIDCVSRILNFPKWNRREAVAKVRFGFPSCRKRSSRTVVYRNYEGTRSGVYD